MSAVHCRYATAPEEMWAGTGPHDVKRVKEPERFLCAWAHYHPTSPEKLTDTPPWLQRNALAGHLMREGDCERCPCFERGDPVE